MTNSYVGFTFKGKHYIANADRWRTDDDIVLPSGEVVTFEYWSPNKYGGLEPRGIHLSKPHLSRTSEDKRITPEQYARKYRLEMAEEHPEMYRLSVKKKKKPSKK